MEPLQLLIIVTLLAVLVEVSYLVVKLPRQTAARSGGRMILVDTSVLIDGRIVAVAKTSFIGGTLVIPRSVVGELQFLADNADHDKRARARFGLDVVTELQNLPEVEVEILQDGSKADEGVDERLLLLAKKYTAVICTIDYNLNKVAVVEGITVLNINELAQNLRMAHLPGEHMMLELVQKGQDSHQGVGYLPDGTMVVVEHANKFIGQSVEIEFIRSLQTAAGKMMFARLVENKPQSQQQKPPKPQGKKPVEPKAATTVYHSDKNDRQVVNKQSQSQRTSNPQKHVQQKPEVAKPQQEKPSRNQNNHQSAKKRPKTSQQREAALIDLVEKQ